MSARTTSFRLIYASYPPHKQAIKRIIYTLIEYIKYNGIYIEQIISRVLKYLFNCVGTGDFFIENLISNQNVQEYIYLEYSF